MDSKVANLKREQTEPINQCDGCSLGLPVDEKGNHLRDGAVFGIHQSCTKHKYANLKREQTEPDGPENVRKAFNGERHVFIDGSHTDAASCRVCGEERDSDIHATPKPAPEPPCAYCNGEGCPNCNLVPNRMQPAPERVGLTRYEIVALHRNARDGGCEAAWDSNPSPDGAFVDADEAIALIQSLRERVEELEKVLENSSIVFPGGATAYIDRVHNAEKLAREWKARYEGMAILHSEKCSAIENGDLVWRDRLADTLQNKLLTEKVAQLESQLSALQWVEVTPETMPPEGENVLILCRGSVLVGRWTEQRYTNSGRRFKSWSCGASWRLTSHWQPLPPPPATGEKP